MIEPMMQGTVLLFDTETTGVGDKPEVIECAWSFLFDDGVPFVPRLGFGAETDGYGRWKPEGEITLGAMATHHIIPSDLDGMPSSKLFRLPEAHYYVGHNVDFDMRAAGRTEGKRICTLALSRWLWPDLDSHKLGAMMYFLMGHGEARQMLTKAHSAVADVEMTLDLLVEICKRVKPDSWESLYQTSEEARVPQVMAFGKHKGTKVSECPPDYLQWMLRQVDMDEYVKKAARRALGIPEPEKKT